LYDPLPFVARLAIASTLALAPAAWVTFGLPAAGGFVFGSAIALLNFRILGGQVRAVLALHSPVASKMAVSGFMLRIMVYAVTFTVAYLGLGLPPVAMALGTLTLRVGIWALPVQHYLQTRSTLSRGPRPNPKGA